MAFYQAIRKRKSNVMDLESILMSELSQKERNRDWISFKYRIRRNTVRQ